MTGYRERLYRSYVSSHLGTYRVVTEETLEQDKRLFRALYRKFLPDSRCAEILEVGCGTGSFLHFLRSEGYRKIRGVDLGEEQIAVARRLGIEEAEVGEAMAYLDRYPDTFDLIVAFDVVEHLGKSEILTFLDRVHVALRRGGRVLLRTPNADSPYHSWIRYGDFTHEVTLSPTSMRQILRVTGFTDIRVFPLEPHVHGPASAGRWGLWQVMKQLIRIYLLIEQGVPGSGIFTANLCAVGTKA